MFPEAPAETLKTLRSRLVDKITQHFKHYTEERNEKEATRLLGYFAAVDAHWDGLRTYRYVSSLTQRPRTLAPRGASARTASSPRFAQYVL